jgi:hypothetical protein
MGPLRSAFDHKRYADPYTDVTLDVRHLQTARWQQRPLLGFLRRPPDLEDLLHAGPDRHVAASRRILRCAARYPWYAMGNAFNHSGHALAGRGQIDLIRF